MDHILESFNTCKDEFVKTINSLGYKYPTWKIFSDFCEMAAISLYQPFARDEALEEQYLKIIGAYPKEDVAIFPKLLSLVINGLSYGLGDFLGEAFMELELGNKYKGQFFTPYYISKFMAQILGNNTQDIESLSEPACGSGGMIIARADALLQEKINYQQVMQVQAVDIDELCVHMCYIQLTLLHIPAEVIHGNSLSFEVFNTWYTPAYIMRATQKDFPSWKSIKEDETVKVKVSIESEENQMIYSKEQREVFATGRLFM